MSHKPFTVPSYDCLGHIRTSSATVGFFDLTTGVTADRNSGPLSLEGEQLCKRRKRNHLDSTDVTDFQGMNNGGLSILNRKRIERRNPSSFTVTKRQLPLEMLRKLDELTRAIDGQISAHHCQRRP